MPIAHVVYGVLQIKYRILLNKLSILLKEVVLYILTTYARVYLEKSNKPT